MTVSSREVDTADRRYLGIIFNNKILFFFFFICVNLPEIKDMPFMLTAFKNSATNAVVKEYLLLK